MATRIEALASFSNKEKLTHVGGSLSTGQQAVVNDEYAAELGRMNLAEVVEEDATAETTDSQETDQQEPGPQENTAEGPSQEESVQEGPGQQQTSETEDFEVETGTSTDFQHTDYVDEDGTITAAMPHDAVLAGQNITTFEELAQYAGDFQEIKGIGPSSEEDLDSAWNEIVGTQ